LIIKEYKIVKVILEYLQMTRVLLDSIKTSKWALVTFNCKNHTLLAMCTNNATKGH
jgi:hypothetical protein